MKCDVRKEEDILSMMSAIKSQFGGADICVNNAGLSHNAPLLTSDTEKWREMLEVSAITDITYTTKRCLLFLVIYKVNYA